MSTLNLLDGDLKLVPSLNHSSICIIKVVKNQDTGIRINMKMRKMFQFRELISFMEDPFLTTGKIKLSIVE